MNIYNGTYIICLFLNKCVIYNKTQESSVNVYLLLGTISYSNEYNYKNSIESSSVIHFFLIVLIGVLIFI